MTHFSISVAICTFNRAASLRETLRSIEEMRHPANVDWELIVVDNNSTDYTRDVVEAFAASVRWPVVYALEAAQGLSHARNKAVQLASGAYIAFTDDDVLVCPDWLEAYVDAIKAWPEAAVFAGPIRPIFEGGAPEWLERALPSIGGAFAMRDLGAQPRTLTPDGPDVPFGANMMLRMKEQSALSYDPKLGAGSAENFMGEETTLVRAILRTGVEGRWVPGAAVQHVIPKSRQTVKYLWRWYETYGRTITKISAATDTGDAQILRVPRWLYRALVVSYIKYLVVRIFGTPKIWCAALARAATYRGSFKQYLRMR